MRLGIDFGTTRTVVSAAVDGRYPVAMFETPRGYSDYLPGLVAFDDGRFSHGWDAANVMAEQPAAAIRSIKRVVGRLAPDDRVPDLPQDDLCALALLTQYLRFVREMLSERSNLDLGGEPLEAMVAVPANANTRQRYLTLEAFSRAGFRVLGMVNEPTAAAIEFAHRNVGAIGRRSPKRYVVVYDLGGGTFDTSAVSLTGRRFELMTSEGISELGGDDFDQIILDAALEQIGTTSERLSAPVRAALLERCREAKESIGPSSRKLLIELLPELGARDAITLELAPIYERAQPLVDRTVELVQRVFTKLESYGIDPNNARELGAVYLVGGATAFPPVLKTLRQLYKRKIQLAPQPHAATAVGLAIAADANAGIFVHESVTRHFGVWREADGGREKIYDPIFGKDTATGESNVLVSERRYRPAHAVGHLRFVECTELSQVGDPSGDLTPWGELYFPYDPRLLGHDDLERFADQRAPDIGEQEIVERYEYGRDGTVRVQIENRTHGYARAYHVRVADFHERGSGGFEIGDYNS
jgi:molecular chaperone DnaK (HSP70)